MKRGIVFFALFLAVTLLIALAIQHSTQAQQQDRPGGQFPRGRRGSFMITRSLNLESSWAHLCFEMKIDDKVMTKARGIYKKAWDDRAKLLKDLEEAGDDEEAMNAATSKADKIKADMLAKLKDALSSAEMEKLAEWEKSQQQQRQRMRTPPGPPGM
jgi:hypothetical protein